MGFPEVNLPKKEFIEIIQKTVVNNIINESEDMLGNKEIGAILGSLMEIKNAEAMQMSMNNFINLRGITNIKEFKNKLEAFNKTGNGLMIVNPEVFKGIKPQQVKDIMTASGKCGVKLYADLREEQYKNTSVEELMRQGFSGYVREINNKMVIYDFVISKDGVIAEEVSGYGNLEQFKAKMKVTVVPNRILNLDELEGLLRGGERSIIDRVTVEELLKTTALSLFKGEVNEVYARGVGYKISRDKLPEISTTFYNAVSGFKKMSSNDILKAMGLENTINPVSVYYSKLAGDVSDKAKLEQVRKEFLQAVIERMLAKDSLARLENSPKPEGLEETDLEELLGKAILEQKSNGYEATGPSTQAEQFMADNNNLAADKFFAKLKEKIMDLNSEHSPQAINSMIKLIEYAEPKFIKRTEKQRMTFNPKLIDAVLVAG